MEAVGLTDSVKLFLVVSFCPAFANGWERSAFFKSGSAHTGGSSMKFVIIGCAASCLARDSCLSFTVQLKKTKCAFVTHVCGIAERKGSCYSRKHFQNKKKIGQSTDGSVNSRADELSVADGVPRETDRLLLLPFHSNVVGKEMDLRTTIMRDYEDKTLTYVRSVAFMPKTSKLVVCMGKNPSIFISPLQYGGEVPKREIIRNGTEALKLGVDEESKIIFLISVDRGNYQRTMCKIVGKHMNKIKLGSDDQFPQCFDVDAKRKQLYVSSGYHVCQYDYRGHETGRRCLISGPEVTVLGLDTERNKLYYNIGSALFTTDITGVGTKKVATLSAKFTNILFYKNSIWVNFGTLDKLCHVGVTGEEVYNCTRLAVPLPLMCLIKG